MQEVIDPALLNQVLSTSPFISIPGILNLRDIGALWSPYARPGLVCRSGALIDLPESSLSRLQHGLGVKYIIDMRSEREIAHSPESHHSQGAKCTSYEHESAKQGGFERVYRGRWEERICESVRRGFRETPAKHPGSAGMAKRRGDAVVVPLYRSVLFFLLLAATEGIVVAGKDRTGVLAAVILGLAGVPRDLIALDYALTLLGIEPGREMLTAMLRLWYKDWSPDSPGMAEFAQVKACFMVGTLEMADEKYGGMEGYVKGELGLSDGDVEKIRGVLKGD